MPTFTRHPTVNDAIDVIDIARDQYIESIPGLQGWQERLCLKRVNSFLHPTEAKILSRCLRHVPCGTLSRFPLA
jgi:hypothetical protein